MKHIILLLVLSSMSIAYGVTLKLAVLAPEGSTWGKSLKGMAKEISEKTEGKVKLKIYYGGVAGDEPDVLRKIRIGQMHGGVFTGRALGDINGDVRAIEIPFSFGKDRSKAWDTLKKAEPFFNKGFEKEKFVNLAFFEIGLVYVVSTKEIKSLQDLKSVKIWSWEGDDLVGNLVKTMQLVSVPLPLPDVLTSLTTGIIEAAYSSPLGVLALQWNTKVKYLIDFPVSFSIGAFLVHQKQWKKVPAKFQSVVRELAQKHIDMANAKTINENNQAIEIMKSSGIKILKFPEADIAQGRVIREKVVKNLTGKLFSKEALKKSESLLDWKK